MYRLVARWTDFVDVFSFREDAITERCATHSAPHRPDRPPANDIMSTKNTKPTSTKTATKKAKASTAPATVLDKILVAIRSQPHTSDKGVSRTAIAKYLQTQYKYDNPNALKRALQNGVMNQTLIQTGHSFRVAGDPVVSIPTVQVTIEDLVVGNSSEAKKGDTVTVKYEGKLDGGTVFDAANSFTFTLGVGDVIKGKQSFSSSIQLVQCISTLLFSAKAGTKELWE